MHHDSISYSCDFFTKRNHQKYTLKLLQISQKIIYIHHIFEIMVVIRSAARFYYSVP